MSNTTKKTSPARPKLNTPAPKKRTPTKRKAEHSEAIRSITPPPSANASIKKYHQISHGAIWVLVLGLAGYLALALMTFHVDDPSLLRGISSTVDIHNRAGLLGAYVADVGYHGLGLSAWWFVAAAFVWLYKNFRMFNVENEAHSGLLFGIGLGIILFCSPMVERLLLAGKLDNVLVQGAGGWVGAITTDAFTTYLGKGGSLFILIVLIAVGLKLLVQFSYHELALQLWEKAKQQWRFIMERDINNPPSDTIAPSLSQILIQKPWQKWFSGSLKNPKTPKNPQKNTPNAKKTNKKNDPPHTSETESFSHKINQKLHDTLQRLPSTKRKKLKVLPTDTPEPVAAVVEVEEEPIEDGVYRLPQANRLHINSETLVQTMDAEALQPTADLITEKLSEFGIKVSVENAISGPVLTRYEIKPDKGVKGAQIVNLAKDLARSMALHSVRVVETIAGKNTMGIELPNEVRKNVLLHDILASNVFAQSESKLSIALGTDIAGFPVVGDLAKMPHLLVGGMTGSGKSVGVNAMIMSILFKAKPDEVRFIMIDPKMLELSIYDGIPHLLCPVVTDMKEAGHALNWCVAEMEKRYRLMSHIGVRNVVSYNQKIREANENGETLSNPFSLNPDEPEPLETLPYIVLVIDELADLIMTERKAVETQITRIAQKARAAGIHMIIATQRPSVDVITGLIKANIPTRMAFTVQSKIDSRTILDQMGAEDLLKNGDLLFLQPGNASPIRLQGAFVSDDEVHDVVSFIKSQGEPNYVEGLLTGESLLNNQPLLSVLPADLLTVMPHAEKSKLFQEAVEFVCNTRKATISSLQRNFKIGYNRAADLMQELENEGIVSPPESNGMRRILVRREAQKP